MRTDDASRQHQHLSSNSSSPSVRPTPSARPARHIMRVAGWGCAEYGQLGADRASEIVAAPAALPLPPVGGSDGGSAPVGAAAGLTASVVLVRGATAPLVLGDGSGSGGGEGVLPAVVAAAAGDGFVVYLSAGGAVLVGGEGGFGQLGRGEGVGGRGDGVRVVAGLAGVRVAAIAAGARHWLALDAAGRVWACGHNSSGQCGTGATGSLYEPAVVTALWPVAVVAVSAGDSHSAVLTATGDVFCFGSGQYGQIGQPSFSPKVCAVRPLRVAVPGVPGSGGGSAEDDDRDVDMVGNGEEHVERIRGGNGGPSGREDLYYVDVACGGMHTVALRSDGAVVAWGMGEQGQVGHRSTANAYTPVVVRPSAPDADLRFVAVSAGARHSAALSDSGRAFLWGDGSLGQVGDGDVADKLLPVEARPPRVEGGLLAGAAPPRFTRLWCGGWHNIAFVSDSPAAAEPVYVPWTAYRQRVPLVQLDAMVQPKSGFARFSSSAVLTRNFVAPGHGNTVLAGECVKAYARFRTVFGDDGFSVLVRSAARLRHEAQAAFGMRRDGDRLLVTSPTRNAATASIMTASGEVKAMTTPQDRLATEDAFRADVADMRESGIVLFLAFLNPVYEQQSRERMRDLAELIALVVRVRGDARDAFVRGARSCPPEFLEKCFVRPLQRVISEELLGKRRVTKRTTNATKVLGLLHQANEEKLEAILAESGSAAAMRAMTDGGDDPSLSVVPAESFYNDAVSEMIDLKEDWARWNHVQKEIKEGRYGLDGAVVGEDGSNRSRGEGPFSFCEYSFVLNKLAKQKILGVEAHTAMHDELFRSLISFGTLSMPMDFSHAQNMGFLVLDVRRTHIVSDTFHQLAACVAQAPRDLHKTLRVQFQGEPGQDEGGLTKEFFQVLFEELLGGSYGMFVYHEDTRHHWFAQDSPCEPSDFMLVGIAVGLALFNTILLDVQFPSVIYHKLHGALQKALGKRKVAYKATLADVKDVFPDNYNTLRHVLEYDGDDLENDFGLTYEVGYQSVLGDNCTKELVADGANRPVTKENREEFVPLYIEYLINDSIAESFDQFSQGIFGMLAHGNFVSKVSASELETLVVGEVELDFEALRAATKYEGYSADSPVIKYLWEVLFSFDVESRKKFLSFVCGSDRAPIGGLGNLKLLIQRSSGDSDRLPTAHTCFNVLLLPEYATRAKVDALLRVAINNSTGFGLN